MYLDISSLNISLSFFKSSTDNNFSFSCPLAIFVFKNSLTVFSLLLSTKFNISKYSVAFLFLAKSSNVSSIICFSFNNPSLFSFELLSISFFIKFKSSFILSFIFLNFISNNIADILFVNSCISLINAFCPSSKFLYSCLCSPYNDHFTDASLIIASNTLVAITKRP